MRKTIGSLCLLLALFITGPVLGQSKTPAAWMADFDARAFGSFSYDNQTGVSDYVAAALKSHSGHDMYFEGLSIIFGLTKAWQVDGDRRYLHIALDIAQSDVRAAVDLQTYYSTYPNGPTGNMGTYDQRNYPFDGHPAHTNYFMETDGRPWSGNENFYTNPDRGQYINNANDGDEFGVNFQNYRSYGHMSIQPSNGPEGVYNSLQTSIYWRFVADMVRIMYNNDGSNGFALSQTSNNGQTYQARVDEIVAFLENEYIGLWRDHSPNNPGAWFYRVNTHMASHFASISLSLYVITGKAEYLTTLNQWLYDWGEAAASPRPDGVGFMDQLRLENGGYYWANSWGSNTGYTDIGHAHAELHLLSQIYDEGLGQSPPDGSPVIDAVFIDDISEMMREGVLKGYTCADGANEPQISYFINGTGNNDGLTAGSALWAIYEPNILCHMEQQDRFGWDEFGIRAAGAYAARVHGVGGADPPVFPSSGAGGGTAPTNNPPNVSLVGSDVFTVQLGGTYQEFGATWTDIQDGSGTIASPTSGSVNTSLVGNYILTYSYTDAGGLTDSVTRRVDVINTTNNCPVVTLSGASTIEVQLNASYIEQGATWTDVEDGSGGALISGDTVDTSTLGTYLVRYSYTDSSGCLSEAFRTVNVVDSVILATSLMWVYASPTIGFYGRIYPQVGINSFLPSFTIGPADRTQPFAAVSAYPEGYAEVDGNGFLTPLRDGYYTAEISTFDGSNLVDTMTIEQIIPQTRANRAVTIIMQ